MEQSLKAVQNQIKGYLEEIGDSKSTELLSLLPTGKMLRSKLILKIAGESDQSIRLCAIVEMIHGASLLHDDVIDDADTRRGQKTINALFDNKTSIMFGDILYSKGFTELTKMPHTIAHTIASSVTKLSVGELLDVELSKKFNNSYDLYLDMIYKKTASLIEGCAQSAAILSNKDPLAFGLYGKNLGLAFQMIDDILDITEESSKLGKPAMNDFIEGKVTIPYLLAWERSDLVTRARIESFYMKKLDFDQLMILKNILLTTEAISDSIALARKFGKEAIDAIGNENNEALVEIMKAMIERDF